LGAVATGILGGIAAISGPLGWLAYGLGATTVGLVGGTVYQNSNKNGLEK
jgi:hypothetical protein